MTQQAISWFLCQILEVGCFIYVNLHFGEIIWFYLVKAFEFAYVKLSYSFTLLILFFFTLTQVHIIVHTLHINSLSSCAPWYIWLKIKNTSCCICWSLWKYLMYFIPYWLNCSNIFLLNVWVWFLCHFPWHFTVSNFPFK